MGWIRAAVLRLRVFSRRALAAVLSGCMLTEITIALTVKFLVTISVQGLLLNRKLLTSGQHLGQAALTTEVEHYDPFRYLGVKKFGKMPRS